MSRSKRLKRVADATPELMSHLSDGRLSPQTELVESLVPFSWFLMCSWITASSRPKVETKYPLAQKCCPTKLRLRSPYHRRQMSANSLMAAATPCQ